MNLEENIDKTIDSICNWIQEATKASSYDGKTNTIPEMTRALAELVSARAEIGGTSEELKIKKNRRSIGRTFNAAGKMKTWFHQ